MQRALAAARLPAELRHFIQSMMGGEARLVLQGLAGWLIGTWVGCSGQEGHAGQVVGRRAGGSRRATGSETQSRGGGAGV